ncbi:MAG: HAD family hydrolase [Rhodococcus fascians]
MTRPSAILFDLDGTLLESEHLYSDIGAEMVEAAGGAWTEADRLASVGTALPDFSVLLQRAGLARPTSEIVAAVVDHVTERMRAAVPWRPGALELLDSVEAAGLPCALVTMTYRDTVSVLLDQSEALPFDVVITGDDVVHGKPHPEPYLLAARHLGVAPEKCVAIEDSVLGLTSAGRAGLTRIAVPLDAEIDSDLYEARWGTLLGRSIADILDVWRRCSA